MFFQSISILFPSIMALCSDVLRLQRLTAPILLSSLTSQGNNTITVGHKNSRGETDALQNLNLFCPKHLPKLKKKFSILSRRMQVAQLQLLFRLHLTLSSPKPAGFYQLAENESSISCCFLIPASTGIQASFVVSPS